MSINHTTVALPKDLHKRFVAKAKAAGVSVQVLTARLVEMYLDGDVAVVIPSKKV